MITENSSGFKAFTATAVAIEAYTRVVLGSGGTISVAGANSLGVGFTTAVCAASGIVNVALIANPGTVMVQAAGVIPIGAFLFAAAAGEVAATGTYRLNMIALDAATAQGDVIEAAFTHVQAHTSDTYADGDTAILAAAGTTQGTAGIIASKLTYVTLSDGTKGVVLPTASAALVYEVVNTVGDQTLKVYPGASDTLNGGTVNVPLTLAVGGWAKFVADDSTNWTATGSLS